MTLKKVSNSPAECGHERSHIVDSPFYGHRYSTQASHRIFCNDCRFQRWLDVEAALALSQAELGMIPSAKADLIAAAAHVEYLDLGKVSAEIRKTGHSLVGLLHVWQEVLEDGAGEFIHYGATTQDIQDTGQSLEMKEVVHEVEAGLQRLLETMLQLARSHGSALMVGRTHGQPALPMTFGIKLASWMDEILRHVERLEAMKDRVVVAQLFGGVGTMAGFDNHGPALLHVFSQRLGLGAPAVAWHVARDRVAEYGSTLAMVTMTLARVAEEIRMLSRPELGEFEETWRSGNVGSSTMPHKRNPEGCEQVVVMARLGAAQAGILVNSMFVEHERDSRGLRLEWAAAADVSHYCLAALAILGDIVGGLIVHSERMAQHARSAADGVCSEALMLALGQHIGKQSAHAHVYELSQAARSQGRPLREVLSESPVVMGALTDCDLDELFDPGRYLGSSAELLEGAVDLTEKWIASRRME